MRLGSRERLGPNVREDDLHAGLRESDRQCESAAAAHEHKLIAIRVLQKQHHPGIAQLLYGD